MATSEILGLFQTPDQYSAAQDAALQRQFIQRATLDPFQKASVLGQQAGYSAAQGIGGALGGKDPQLEMISRRNVLLGQLDPNDPKSYGRVAEAAARMGDSQFAVAIAQEGRKAASEMALAQQRLEEKKTPQERNAAAYARTVAEPGTPQYNSILQTTLQELINKEKPELNTEQMKNAKAFALKAGPEGSAEYNAEFGLRLEQLTAKADKAPPSMVAEYQFAKTPDGGNFKGSYQDFILARATAGRAPAQPRAEQPPVAVIDPKTGKQILVSREEALAGRMTPVSGFEGLSPKEIQLREAKYPQATIAVKTFETKSESFAKDLERLANHPGLSGISGLVYGRTPPVTKEARQAQAIYDSIVARGGFQELQDLRSSSPTGGALGNVSNQEGQNLRDAFAPINRTQDTADLKDTLLKTAATVRGSKDRIKEAYDLTYDYKKQGSQSTSSETSLSAEDKQALDWASKNPNDPRSAQIKNRLGAK
jgi:hypothetical protein